MLGLDHSGIAHSVMYRFGDAGLGRERALSTDDAIGIAVLRPGAPSIPWSGPSRDKSP